MSHARSPWRWQLVLLLGVLLRAPIALAESVDGLTPGPQTEPVDRTRLDVARLPPEAATITRDLYSRGLFAEAQLGARTFAGDARRVSRAGPRFAIALGYEVTRWFALLLELDASMHATHHPTPPATSSFELLSTSLGVRFTLPLGARAALWLGGLAGIAWTSADLLRALGYRDADELRPSWGGELGSDWHLPSRHYSLGLLAGARQYPGLKSARTTLGVHAAAYLRYVF